jgi:hypothetical protein
VKRPIDIAGVINADDGCDIGAYEVETGIEVDDFLRTRNPRIFALYAGLPSHTWPETLTPEGWRATLATYRPAYVIEERWQTSEEATTLAGLVATYPVSFENAAYRLRAIPAAALGR